LQGTVVIQQGVTAGEQEAGVWVCVTVEQILDCAA
jgi:hypothetical protein